jgi:putative phosphoribosyl transferase
MTATISTRSEARSVAIPVDGAYLQGDLTVPTDPRGLILFAHGSGSGRLSPRNRMVARLLQEQRFGTLLFDLLTEHEAVVDMRSAALRFDIELLAARLLVAAEWLVAQPVAESLALGYFGASTGAAAALLAAAWQPELVSAIVSRGGRPDLAGSALKEVPTPTLLIVGGDDSTVIRLNEGALARLAAPVKELVIVPGASHLFEEPGTLEEVAYIASIWFARHLHRRPTPSR